MASNTIDKDAFYFPHFSNASRDRKIRRAENELGIEAYAIFFKLLEVLREQTDYKYPIEDIDLLAKDFGTTKEKIETVITRYDLFYLDEENNFFSSNLIVYLQPMFETRYNKKIGGIRGNLIRYNRITKEESKSMSDDEILEKARQCGFEVENVSKDYNLSLCERTPIAQPRKVKESKENERKVKESKGKESNTSSFSHSEGGMIGSNTPTYPQADPAPWDRDLQGEFEGFKSHWNSLGLPESRRTAYNVPNWPDIASVIQLYEYEEIIEAIDNYHDLKDRQSVMPYKSLLGFLEKGIEKFAASAKPHESFKMTDEERTAKAVEEYKRSRQYETR